ncbi:cyclic di-GMP binding protein [Vibrio sp. MACH09]|nr:cyclic di-GMP binding protein [Vibrio sp. MACH09]
MNARASMVKRENRIDVKNEPAINGTESTMNSTDAIDMVSHGSELTINLTTPVGIRYLGKTKFIGTHSDNFMLLEVPELSDDDFAFFFQEGFWMNVRAISQKGEGALIHFRSQIMHILLEPVPIIMISIPGMMKINQLRKEPRYDVNLKAHAVTESLRLECEIRDLSKGGCRFITSPLAKHFDVGDYITVNIPTPNGSKVQLSPLSGTICNLQSSMHYAKYGLKFDEEGLKNVQGILSHLKFDGVKLSLKL